MERLTIKQKDDLFRPSLTILAGDTIKLSGIYAVLAHLGYSYKYIQDWAVNSSLLDKKGRGWYYVRKRAKSAAETLKRAERGIKEDPQQMDTFAGEQPACEHHIPEHEVRKTEEPIKGRTVKGVWINEAGTLPITSQMTFSIFWGLFTFKRERSIK